jgi:hypothetical protein
VWFGFSLVTLACKPRFARALDQSASSMMANFVRQNGCVMVNFVRKNGCVMFEVELNSFMIGEIKNVREGILRAQQNHVRTTIKQFHPQTLHISRKHHGIYGYMCDNTYFCARSSSQT